MIYKEREIKEKIDKIFEESNHKSDVLVAIYKIVFPDWDKIEKIKNWPKCGKRLWLYICDKFIEFDAKYHPNVLKGGLWMNSGFSSNGSLKDWEIDISEIKIRYKEDK